jgi:hypothetical protein
MWASVSLAITLAAAIHLHPGDTEAINQYMEKISLLEQGLLKTDSSVRRPTLIINGDLDNLVARGRMERWC